MIAFIMSWQIIIRLYIIEIAIVFIFNEMVSETFKYLEEDGYGFGIVALT